MCSGQFEFPRKIIGEGCLVGMLRLQSAVKFKPVRRGVPNIVSTTHSLLVRTKGKCLPTEPTKRYAGESVRQLDAIINRPLGSQRQNRKQRLLCSVF